MDFTPIDFASITRENIANLDFNNPHLIAQCQLKPILLLNHMTMLELKSEMNRNLIISAIITNHFYKLYWMLKGLSKSNISISFEKLDDNSIDFLSMTKDDILELNFNDPNLIEQCKIKSILSDPYMSHQEVKTELLKNVVTTRIVSHQHDILFKRYRVICERVIGEANV